MDNNAPSPESGHDGAMDDAKYTFEEALSTGAINFADVNAGVADGRLEYVTDADENTSLERLSKKADAASLPAGIDPKSYLVGLVFGYTLQKHESREV